MATSTANIESPLREAAIVDGPGEGKVSARTTEDENALACRGWPNTSVMLACSFTLYSA